MSQTVEYNQLDGIPCALREVLSSAPLGRNPATTVELARVCYGWESAGSMARIVDPYISVRYQMDGAWHGRRFRPDDMASAQAFYNRLTQQA